MIHVVLKAQREKSVLRKHPWIFSGAIKSVEGTPGIGETVEVIHAKGMLLGRGAFSPRSQITIRMWTFDADEEVSTAFFRTRIHKSIQARQTSFLPGESTACRLINAESDGLPGLIVDRYGDYLVCQFTSAGAEFWKDTVIPILQEMIPCKGIYERSDLEVREKEGLVKRAGLMAGEEPSDIIEIQEGPCLFAVDIRHGQKTGFYLDQRGNRAVMADYADKAEVLDCFAYTGGFSVLALKSGASTVTNIESSSTATELILYNLRLNALDEGKMENIEGDVFKQLRKFRDSRRQFDLIILDPPKFIESQSQLMHGSRAYKDINLLAFKLLRENGILFTFSCSGLMKPDLFQKIVADAALDAGRDVQIIRWLSQAPDHPTALNFPEGQYLKGLICRVV